MVIVYFITLSKLWHFIQFQRPKFCHLKPAKNFNLILRAFLVVQSSQLAQCHKDSLYPLKSRLCSVLAEVSESNPGFRT